MRPKAKEKRSSRLENKGISEEELLRQQQLLFEQARLKYQQQLASPTNAEPPSAPSALEAATTSAEPEHTSAKPEEDTA